MAAVVRFCNRQEAVSFIICTFICSTDTCFALEGSEKVRQLRSSTESPRIAMLCDAIKPKKTYFLLKVR